MASKTQEPNGQILKKQISQIQEVEIEFGFHGFISPSQDYLVVNARNKEGGFSDFYWVNTEVISKLKMTYFKKLEQ